MTKPMHPDHPILVVDDEQHALQSTQRLLRSCGINHVRCCDDSRQVEQLIGESSFTAVLLDLSMPHLSGEALLPLVVEECPDTPVIIVTGANEVATAVRCMQNGAFDYMVKPVEKSRLRSCVERAIELRELRQENYRLRQQILSDGLSHPDAFEHLVTRNSAMLSIFRYIETIASTTRPVLITGETGTGKELVAQAVHAVSGRVGNFTAVNAASLDENMFSDTLFGHMKGAYTGADTIRRGLIEQAAHGTLFLDEIGDMGHATQVRLLRLLQEHEYLPLGSDIAKRSDARIIVATNHDLDAQQRDGRFRKDLYYRLRTHHIHIPPLRERLDDLPMLLDHFLEKAADALGKKKPTTPPELLTLLATHSFPGNVREFESMVFDAVSKHGSRVLSMEAFRARLDDGGGRAAHAPTGADDDLSNPTSAFALFDVLPTLRETSHLLIDEAMRRAGGNQTQAARLLGISRTALNKRLNHPSGQESQ